MFLRWDRSYIREEFRFARIVWKRPLVSRVLALYESTITNLRFPVAYSAIALWAVNALHDPASIVRMLLAIMVVSTLYTLYYLRSERSWDFVFGILYGYFLVLRAHLDLSLRGAHAARARLADAAEAQAFTTLSRGRDSGRACRR